MDAKLIGASIVEWVEGTIFKGKIGIKLTFNFNEMLLFLKIHISNDGLSFEFYLEFSVQILW